MFQSESQLLPLVKDQLGPCLSEHEAKNGFSVAGIFTTVLICRCDGHFSSVELLPLISRHVRKGKSGERETLLQRRIGPHSLCQLLQLVFMLSVAGTQSNIELRPVFGSSQPPPPSRPPHPFLVQTLEMETVFKDTDWKEGFILVCTPNPGAKSASNVFEASLEHAAGWSSAYELCFDSLLLVSMQ